MTDAQNGHQARPEAADNLLTGTGKVMEMEAQTEKPRILFVDDSRLIRVAAQRILNEDFDIREAGDGEQAWQQLLDDPDIAVVITDLSMPALDGMGLLARIRRSDDEQLRNLPVIILTGKEDEEKAREDALAAGATDFLSKPFDSVQLLARTQAQASYRQLQQTTLSLEESALADPLTGLANQQHFLVQGSKELAFAKRHTSPFGLALINLEDFGTLYERHGKQAASRLLVESAQRLQELVRQEDTLARIGTTHFALILPFTTPKGARQMAERVIAQFCSSKLRVGRDDIAMRLSIGLVAETPDDSTTFKGMIQSVKQQLAAASQAGGGRVCGCEQQVEPLPAPDLMTALQWLAENKPERVAPHLPVLLGQLLPLLELARATLGLELTEGIEQLHLQAASGDAVIGHGG